MDILVTGYVRKAWQGKPGSNGVGVRLLDLGFESYHHLWLVDIYMHIP